MPIEDYARNHETFNLLLGPEKPQTTLLQSSAPGTPITKTVSKPKPTPTASATNTTNNTNDNKAKTNPNDVRVIYGNGTSVVIPGAGNTYEPGSDQDPNKQLLDAANPFTILGNMLAVPHQVATGLLLTAGTGVQAIRHLIDAGPNFSWDNQNKWLGDQLNKDWSIVASNPTFTNDQYSQITNAPDIGTSFTYAVGQIVGAGMDIGARATGQSTTTWNKQLDDVSALKTFDQTSKDWGFVMGDLNFDPFSDKQRALISSGDGWKLGNVVTQVGNLAGDITTDPMTYVPMGKLGTLLFAGRRLLTAGGETVVKRVAADAANLSAVAGAKDFAQNTAGKFVGRAEAEAAAGEKLPYYNFLKFVAENDANTIIQHTVIKSITTGDKDRIAYLLGEVTTPQDAAKVLLATEYGSQKAFTELVNARPNLTLALDEMNGGGYLARQTAKGVIGEGVVNAADHQSFYDMIGHYTDQLAQDDFTRVLTGLTTRGTSEGIAGAMTGLRELTPLKSTLMSAIENTGAHIGSYIIHGATHDGSTQVTRLLTQFGSSKFMHYVTRPLTTVAKGLINVEDLDGLAGQKFYAMLGDIDHFTKGALTANGNRDILTKAWMKAISPAERAHVINTAQELGLTEMARKAGGYELSADTVQQIVDGLSKNRKVFVDNLDRSGKAVIRMNDYHAFAKDTMGIVQESIANGEPVMDAIANTPAHEIIYHDPFMLGQTANNVMIWDWKAVDRAFMENVYPVRAFLRNVADAPAWLNNKVNQIFQGLILLKAGRFFRDAYQNFVSASLSGYGREILKSNLELNSKYLNPVTWLSGGLKKVPYAVTGIVNNFEKPHILGQALTAIESEHDVLYDTLRNISDTIYNTTALGKDTTFGDLNSALAATKELQSEIHYHASTSGYTNGSLDTNRGLATFGSKKEASQYLANQATTYGAVDVSATTALPDSIGKSITIDVKNKVGKALANGDVVHVRLASRGRSWQLVDPNKLLTQTDADIAKYEYRVISKNQLAKTGATTGYDLVNMFKDGHVVWTKDANNIWTIRSLDELASLPTPLPDGFSARVFPKGMNPEVKTVKNYGDSLVVSKYADLPSDVAKSFGVKSQAELDRWIAKNGYDKLTPAQLTVLEDSGIGRLKVINSKNESVTIVNPRYVGDASLNKILQATYKKMGIQTDDLAHLDTHQFTGFPEAQTPSTMTIGEMAAEQARKENLYKQLTTYIQTDVKKLKKITETSKTNVEKMANPSTRLATDEFSATMNELNALLGIKDSAPGLVQTIAAAKERIATLAETKVAVERNLMESNSYWTARANAKEANKIFKAPYTKGNVDVNGTSFSNALAGDNGQILINQILKDASEARLYNTQAPVDGIVTTRVIKPHEQGYWESWADVLNRNFQHNGKLDPVVRMVLEGRVAGKADEAIAADIHAWAETAEGKKYLDAVGVGHKYAYATLNTGAFKRPGRIRTEGVTLEDFIDRNIHNVDNHVGSINAHGAGPAEFEEPRNPIAEKLLAGEQVSPKDLTDYRIGGKPSLTTTGYANQPDFGSHTLPDIWASITDPAYRNKVALGLSKAYHTWNKAVTEQPQAVAFQSPMAQIAYKRSLERQIAQATVAADLPAGSAVKFTEAQVIEMEKKARSFALQQTRKYIYSSHQNLKWQDAIRGLVPFSNAALFTIRNLRDAAMERPQGLARMVYFMNKANQSVTWVDQYGNPVAWNDKDPKTGQPKAVGVMLPIPDIFKEALGQVPGFNVDKFMLSRQSLDPVFAGAYDKNFFGIPLPGGAQMPFDTPNPFKAFGLTPIAAVGLGEAVKGQATKGGWAVDLTKLMPNLLPIGPSAKPAGLEGLLQQVIPSPVIKEIGSLRNDNIPVISDIATYLTDNGFDGGLWQKTVLNTTQYLAGQYALGKFKVPEGSTLSKEIIKRAGVMYDIKANSDFWVPMSTTYLTAGDIARNQYKGILSSVEDLKTNNPTAYAQLVAANDPNDPNSNPTTVAQNIFLANNGEYFEAVVSQTDNTYGANGSPTALDNINKYKPILDDVKSAATTNNLNPKFVNDVYSYIVNEDWNNQTSTANTFDQNVWAALQSQGYIGKINPDDYINRINTKLAQLYYFNGYTYKDANGNMVKLKGMNEIPRSGFYPDGSSTQPDIDRLKKQLGVAPNGVGDAFRSWMYNPDPQRYNTVNNIWWKVLANKDYWNGAVQKNNGLPPKLYGEIAQFLIMRNDDRNKIIANGQVTGNYTLSSNPMIKNHYDTQVAILRQNDPDFDTWYGTFFEGDTVY